MDFEKFYQYFVASVKRGQIHDAMLFLRSVRKYCQNKGIEIPKSFRPYMAALR